MENKLGQNALAPSSMIKMDLVQDPEILQSAGAVSIAHGQLEHILKMTVKTLSGLTVDEALTATSKMKAWEVRKCIKKLFYDKTTDETMRLKIRVLLNKAEDVSEERNQLIHRPWGIDEHGNIIVKFPDHVWGDPPTPEMLQALAIRINGVAIEFNTARLDGFIEEVVGATL